MNPTASQIQRLMACPASNALPHVESTSPWAKDGTELHSFLASVNDGEDVDRALGKIESERAYAICDSFDWARMPVGVQFAAEVSIAIDVATGKARELGRGMGREAAYRFLTPFEVAGTIDVVALAPGYVAIWDYKSGFKRQQAKTSWQLRTLSVIAARLWDKPEARAALIFVPEAHVEWQSRARFDRLDLDTFLMQLRAMHTDIAAEAGFVADGTAKFKAGPHCDYCPAFSSCPAQMSLVRRLTGGDLEAELRSYHPLTPASAGVAWRQIKAAEMWLKKAKTAVLLYAKKYGPVDIGEGVHLGELTKDGNRRYDGKLAHRVIEGRWGRRVADEAVGLSVSQASIRRALVDSQEVGGIKVGPELKLILEAVEEQGGMSRKSSTTLGAFTINKEKKI